MNNELLEQSSPESLPLLSVKAAGEQSLTLFNGQWYSEDGEAIAIAPPETKDPLEIGLDEERAAAAMRTIFMKEMALKSKVVEMEAALAAIKEHCTPGINKATRSVEFWRTVYGGQLQRFFSWWRSANPKVINRGKSDQRTELPKSWKSTHGVFKTMLREGGVVTLPDAIPDAITALLVDEGLESLLVPRVSIPTLANGQKAKLDDWLKSCPIDGVTVEWGTCIGNGLPIDAAGEVLAEIVEDSKDAQRLFEVTPRKTHGYIDTGLKSYPKTNFGVTPEITPKEEGAE
jgi:hypothetical protein